MTDYVQTVAVDFDGVIHSYSRGWQDGKIYDVPMPGAIDGLHWLMERYAVFILTSRDVVQVAQWLMECGFSTFVEVNGDSCDCEDSNGFTCVHEDQCRKLWNEQGRLLVTKRKLAAIAYIDDRGIRFTNWNALQIEMQARHPAVPR